MNKERMSQILSILLMPYLEKEFCEEGKDVIENIRYSFAELRRRQGKSLGEKERLREEYETAERQLTIFLQNRSELKPRTLDDLRMLLELYFPEAQIADTYDECREHNEKNRHDIERHYFYNIFRIAKSLLTFRDGEAAIRTWMNEKRDGENDIFDCSDIFDKVEIWNQLSRKMVPDVFIMAFYIEAGLDRTFYLHGQTGRILLADKTLERILEKGVAETHFHMNAGINYEILWEKATHLEAWEKRIAAKEEYEKSIDYRKELFGFHVVIFRLVLAHYLEVESGRDRQCSLLGFIEDGAVKELLSSLFYGRQPRYRREWVACYERIHYQWRQRYGKAEGEDFLMDTVYKKYRSYNTHSEMILLQRFLSYLRRKEQDRKALHMFFQYIRVKNHFYSRIVQSNQIQGLDNFQLIYGEMTKKMKDYIPNLNSRMEVIFKSMFHNIHLKKLEIRITAPEVPMYGTSAPQSSRKELRDGILGCIKEILTAYKKYILKSGASSIPTIGIIFHFLKRDFVDNRIADMCWITGESSADSRHMLMWRAQMVKCAQAIEELRSEIPLLAEYIVGIDAASVENKAEPWVFAPVYAAIRNRRITRPLLMTGGGDIVKINNIGFTYHVGEEFRHVLSGLRHVDEVIRFFHYKAGDRIGHAIVLGVDIDKWVEENEVVVMPLIEYLEDLLWLWGLIVHEGVSFDISLDVIEGKILELAKQVYGEIVGVTPNMLYDAYLEKFSLDNSNVFCKMKKTFIVEEPDEDAEHFCRYYNMKAPYGIIWTKEKILCTNFCPIYYQKLHVLIMVHVRRDNCQLLKEVQEKIVRQVEQKGIYVEVNPTSNLVIGGSGSLKESHVFQLNSRSIHGDTIGHEVMVTVNSDDPMIFNTSSENELAYIYHAMNYKGYGKESVIEWVDKVRQYGMDSCFVKREKETGQLLEEMESLLKQIESLQKKA